MFDNDTVRLVVFILVFILPTVAKWFAAAKKRAAEQNRRAESQELEQRESEPRIPREVRRAAAKRYQAAPPPPSLFQDDPVRAAHTTGRSTAPKPPVRAASPDSRETEKTGPVRGKRAVPETANALRRVLHDRTGVRRAILLTEILGRPVSERRQD